MRFLFIHVILILLAANIYGQGLADTIHIKRGYGVSFYQKNRKLSPKSLLNIMASNPEAYKEMKYAKGKSDAAGVCGFIGGFFIGWPIGTAIGGGDPEWSLAAIGALFVVVSIPLSADYKKHTIKAVDIYNSGLKDIGYQEVELRLGVTMNGIGLKLNY